MELETLKTLSEASLSFVLVLIMAMFVFFLFRFLKSQMANQDRIDETARLMANSNLILAKSLETLAATASSNSVAIDKQRESIAANLAQLKADSLKLDAIKTEEDTHALNARARDQAAIVRDEASIVRDQATMKAITDLPSKMRLLYEEETNVLQLQILVAFKDFMAQYAIVAPTIKDIEKAIESVTIAQTAAPVEPEAGEQPTPEPSESLAQERV